MTRSQHTPGKRVGGYLYLHHTALDSLSAAQRGSISRAVLFLPPEVRWSVVKLGQNIGKTVSFLDYENFDDSAFPALRQSCLVDLATGQYAVRRYSAANPPILHRKELLLAPDDPRREEYAKLTSRLEELGLFQNMHKMGYREPWKKILAQHGLDIDGHRRM